MYRHIVIAAVSVLAGCVQTQSVMLSANDAIVVAKGSGFDESATVFREALVEAARVTKARGYEVFQITGIRDTTQEGMIYIPGQTTTFGTVNGSASTFGNRTSINGTYFGTTTTSMGTAVPIVKPGTEIMIRMFHPAEIDLSTPNVWNAESVLAMAPAR